MEILATVSNVLNTKPDVIQKAETKHKSATIILKELDKIAVKLGDTITEGEAITQSTPNVAMQIVKIPVQNYTLQVQLHGTSNISLSKAQNVSKGSSYIGEVSIPESTFKSIPGGFDGKVYAIVYRKDTLFLGNKSTQDEVQSVIISVSLDNKKANGTPAIRLKFVKNNTEPSTCNYWKTAQG